MKVEASSLKEESKKLAQKSKEVETNITNLLISIPNTPHKDVPVGNSEKNNIVIYEAGECHKTADLLHTGI